MQECLVLKEVQVQVITMTYLVCGKLSFNLPT